MTKRVYNYKTKKLYESTGVYVVNIVEDDDNGNTNEYEFEDRFSSVDEARDAIEGAINGIAIKYNDICDCEVIEEGMTTTVNCCDKTYTFTIEPEMENVPMPEPVDDVEESVKETPKQNVNDNVEESVATRFAKLRTLFEDDNEDGGDDNADADNADDNSDDDNKDDNGDEENKDSEDETSEEDMKAVVLTVKKGDEEDCKKEMIDAGISEDDIEILEADDDADEVEIRVDVNSVMELKDYLDKKGINLEDELGGEIVADDEDGEGSDDEKSDDEGNDGGDGNSDDFDFDDFGDIFGGDDEGGEDK